MDELSHNTQDELRKVESHLEEIGRTICSAKGGGDAWNLINSALENVRDAIDSAFWIED